MVEQISSIKEFVKKGYNLFEDVAKSYVKADRKSKDMYTMLDYCDILEDMCEFINGYIKYKDEGNTTYSGKVLPTTISFYDNMFTNSKYRRTMILSEMKEINESFLTKTKKLQDLIDECSERFDKNVDHELKQLINLTDNQYRKLAKVYHDDMNIYLWLACPMLLRNDIDINLKMAFNDISTPVMHRKR